LAAGSLGQRTPEALEALGRLAQRGPLRRQRERIEERRGRQVGDAEPIAGKVLAPVELGLEPVERRNDLPA
jgi:hypothetical protein